MTFSPPQKFQRCFVWMTSTFWIHSQHFFPYLHNQFAFEIIAVQPMNEKCEICALGAVRGARREDSGDVCVRLWQILKTRCHWRSEDSDEHHRSWAADRGVAGSGECRSRGGATSLSISILYMSAKFPLFRHIFSHFDSFPLFLTNVYDIHKARFNFFFFFFNYLLWAFSCIATS